MGTSISTGTSGTSYILCPPSMIMSTLLPSTTAPAPSIVTTVPIITTTSEFLLALDRYPALGDGSNDKWTFWGFDVMDPPPYCDTVPVTSKETHDYDHSELDATPSIIPTPTPGDHYHSIILPGNQVVSLSITTENIVSASTEVPSAPGDGLIGTKLKPREPENDDSTPTNVSGNLYITVTSDGVVQTSTVACYPALDLDYSAITCASDKYVLTSRSYWKWADFVRRQLLPCNVLHVGDHQHRSRHDYGDLELKATPQNLASSDSGRSAPVKQSLMRRSRVRIYPFGRPPHHTAS